MRRILGILASLLLLAVIAAPWASSEPVGDAEATGAGWSVVVGGVAQATLVPEAHACFPATGACPEQETNNLLAGDAIGTTVSATALISEAEAHLNADATATLQAVMQGATPTALPATWNARSYSSVENFSALNGAILADTLEVETVSGTRTLGGATVDAVASGVRVVNLRLAGVLTGQALAPILPGQVNQVLFNQGGVTITYWETNWVANVPGDPSQNLTTSDGQPVWVNALHITAPGGIDIVVSQAEAGSAFVAPPANNPPVAQDDAASTDQGDPVAINVIANDSDPDGNLSASSVTVTVPPANGGVVCNNAGSCTYTPDPGFIGVDTFTYQVCDTNGACDTAVVTITVDPPPPPANVPPVAADDNANTTEETPIPINVVANDSDPDGVLDPSTVTVTVQPADGVVNCNNAGVCTYTPDVGFNGTDTFTYLVCDDDGACDTAVVTIDVNGAPPGGGNLPPIAVDDNDVTNEETPVTVDVATNDSDPEGDLDPTSVLAVTQPANGVAVCSNGSCTYTPDAGFNGADSFDYQICDGGGVCAIATVTITVAGAPPGGGNLPPIATDDAASTDQGLAVGVAVITNDSDPEGDLDPASVTVTQQPANGTVFCNNAGSCTYTPDPGFAGADTFEYLVCDGSSACGTALVTVTVNALAPVNNPPVAQDDAANTNEDTSVNVNVVANDNDPDGNLDPATVQIVDHPDNGAVICNNAGVCTYTPDAGFAGVDTFDYLVCDTDSSCSSATVTVTVAGAAPVGANQPPIAQNDSVTTDAGFPAAVAVTPNDSDPDGTLQPSSVTVTQPPQNGAVICNNGSCTYTPGPGFSGSDSFEYRVCDDQNACDTATVDVTVNPVAGAPAGPPANSPPVAVDDDASTPIGVPVPIVVVANDGDPEGNLDPTSVTMVQPPQNGAVVCSLGTCTYTPAPGFSGSDSFDYRVCDTAGACSTATVTVAVPAVSPPPGGGNGNGGNGNGGNGGGSGGGGNGHPGRDAQPGRPTGPGVVSPAPDPLAPVSQPSLGAPNPLPLTGGEPGFYLTIATSLLVLGLGVLLLDRWGKALRWAAPCPAWHAHEEAHGLKGCTYGNWG